MTPSETRQLFFALRNGIVADAFRKAADPHRMVFGLQITQLSDIARQIGLPAHDLATQLWNERDCRESRLLACWLFDTAALEADEDLALSLARDVQSREEADILVFRQLRRLDSAPRLLKRLREVSAENDADSREIRYSIEALERNLAD